MKWSIRDLTLSLEDPEIFYDAEPEMDQKEQNFSSNGSELDSPKGVKPEEEAYFDFPNQKSRRQCRYA